MIETDRCPLRFASRIPPRGAAVGWDQNASRNQHDDDRREH